MVGVKWPLAPTWCPADCPSVPAVHPCGSILGDQQPSLGFQPYEISCAQKVLLKPKCRSIPVQLGLLGLAGFEEHWVLSGEG